MDKNGRSVYIRTSNRCRSVTWQRIFGTDRLPVMAARPRWICDRAGERLVYDVDMAQVPAAAVYRLAAHVARRTRQPYALVLVEVKSRGFWVDAIDCFVEETAVAKRPFFLWPNVATVGAAYA